MERDDLTARVIGAAVEVQRVFGTGLLESAYAGALALEFDLCGIAFEREVAIAATYKGVAVGHGFRADFVVDRRLIVELKTVDFVATAHRAQLLSYLRLSGLRLGLLINFHQFPVTQAVHRVINNS
ncbi:GxxExxY protein [Ramlibacter algicola]|uniref:GxxExxY protein n=1 Tax=Ramlibacter algicola TaxID=2795217 RepID=A0A934URF6_9BURK|nr:GxxExxY protein [Ramlibacter algicola]MBK0392482.1 GxxExxY protein [Ramlibacter algicola]